MAKIDILAIYDQNGWKTLPFGALHTYIAHTREYPPSGGIRQIVLIYCYLNAISFCITLVYIISNQ